MLLAAMREHARPPKPEALGVIGEASLFGRLAQFGTLAAGRRWYRKTAGTVGSVPFVVEVTVAEVADGYGLVTGLNFAPTYSDPFADTVFRWEHRDTAHTATGLHALLHELRSAPGAESGGQVAVVVHLACPALSFTDKGKTHLALPPAIADARCKSVQGVLCHDKWPALSHTGCRRSDQSRADVGEAVPLLPSGG